jgi:hypothetical protein
VTRPLDDLAPELGGARPPSPGGGRAVLRWIRDAFLDNLAIKFVALVLSLTVFILVHSDEQAVAGATVEVSYTLPPGKILTSEPIEQLKITVRGSRRRIKRFDPATLGRVNIDLRGRGDGQLAFEPGMIDGLPEGLELVSISPPGMLVELADRVERLVPVVVETIGQPARGYRVIRVEALPAQVTVVGAADKLAAVTGVRAAPVSIAGQRGDVVEEVALDPVAGTLIEGGIRVRVTVSIGEEQAERRIGPLEVSIAGVDAAAARGLVVEPRTVELVLRGTALELEKVPSAGFRARVEPGVGFVGSRELEVRIAPVTPGVALEVRPPVVTVRSSP